MKNRIAYFHAIITEKPGKYSDPTYIRSSFSCFLLSLSSPWDMLIKQKGDKCHQQYFFVHISLFFAVRRFTAKITV